MNRLWLSVFSVGLLLVGCSEDDAKTESHETPPEEKAEAEQQNEKKLKKRDVYIESPQAVDDRDLTEVGKPHRDEDGKVKLLAISTSGEQISVGPFKVTLEEAKLMNYSPSPDLIDFFHGFTSKESNFNYVKLKIKVENTSDETLNFSPVSVLETNEGEKKSYEDDFYLEELYGDFESGEKRFGQMGFILEKTEAEKPRVD
ncbi:DUF4352 domain-containing protein [Alkalihalobacillus sp. TS-13]|uniref:DUF4352 domain-containing protein n=1 Tax=Alkalihalobacillus sp. TS-13 TaxID=2842455 RepID=UPI001C87F1E6|nr:DUF4352 domain-containing protein [Alkalihalobacillus sp. TS-13]